MITYTDCSITKGDLLVWESILVFFGLLGNHGVTSTMHIKLNNTWNHESHNDENESDNGNTGEFHFDMWILVTEGFLC